MVPKVLVNAGATVRAYMMMYKAVVHTALLFRIEIWIVTDAMMKVMGGVPK